MSGEKGFTGKQLAEAVGGQWHKICAVLMHKQELSQVDITEADLEALRTSSKNSIVLNATSSHLRLMLVDPAEAARIVIMHAANGKLKD